MAESEKNREPAVMEESAVTERMPDLSDPDLYFDRELNWLAFDARVLEEALDPRLRLLDQLNFLAIFYNNLDEFFMVRVANIYRLYLQGVGSPKDRLSPARELAEIRRRVISLITIAQDYWRKSLAPELKKNGVRLVRYHELSDKQKVYLDGYFKKEIFPILTPQAIDSGHPFPLISNVSLNFIIQLRGEDGLIRYARLKCPDKRNRFVFIPRNKEGKVYASLGLNASVRNEDILLVEDLIREYLETLFPGNEVLNAALFRITRNTDIEIEEDEASDLLEAIKDLVDQRRFGHIIRLEIAHGSSPDLVSFLTEHLKLQPFQIYRVKGPLAFSDMQQLYGIDRPSLKAEPFYPYLAPMFQDADMFTLIRKQDVFLYHPYDSFVPVIDFIRQASRDPNVVAIKQTLYRVGSDTAIVKALVEARKRGKQVTAVVELKARFDEERNITWAEELEKSGAHVVYGLPGMKIHAKLCLVVRREESGIVRYVHIGTGNYNTSTAKLYTDMSLLTSNEDICADVTDIFNAMTGYGHPESYRKLLVSPLFMRKGLLECIEREIELHKEHGGGQIIFKCNQLVDQDIIEALYRASMAGVSIHLLVRGICCLRPGVPGISENITVTALLGRFLEHARVYWFANHGESILYMGSADMMPRNLDRRIEVLTPVLDPEIRRFIRDTALELQLGDNTQTWRLKEDGVYQRVVPAKKARELSSQVQMMNLQRG